MGTLAAQTALALATMLNEVTEILDTVTDLIDENDEWGVINADVVLGSLRNAQALLKGLEG